MTSCCLPAGIPWLLFNSGLSLFFTFPSLLISLLVDNDKESKENTKIMFGASLMQCWALTVLFAVLRYNCSTKSVPQYCRRLLKVLEYWCHVQFFAVPGNTLMNKNSDNNYQINKYVSKNKQYHCLRGHVTQQTDRQHGKGGRKILTKRLGTLR